MKTFIILAVAMVLFGLSCADEDKKAKILKFYKCITCHENPAVEEDYKQCAELKPEKCKKIVEECENKILADFSTEEDQRKAICKNENQESENMYDCIMNHPEKKDLNDEEKTQMKEFLQCAKKLDKKYCESK